MNVSELQYAVGTAVDGKWGPNSKAALWAGIANRSASIMAALAAYVAQQPSGPSFTSLGIALAEHLQPYGIIDNASRLANFLGQSAHETMGFTHYREIWGPTVAQARYEGRADLGNTHPGDGKRFMGRGIFQTTGRANYQTLSKVLGIDLVANPALLETPDLAVISACEYWKSHGLSDLADAGNVGAITRRINGGLNGIEQRRALVARAGRVLG